MEYMSRAGKRVTINLKMITVIIEDKDGCSVYTCDSGDPILLNEPYEKVRDDMQKILYSIATIKTI